MNDYLSHLERTYIDRSCDSRSFVNEWRQILSLYPPNILQYINNERPSLLIAKYAGDLGIAIFWIVQAILIRAFLKDVSMLISSFPVTFAENIIGALAHSEDINMPTVFREIDKNFLFSGKKKYITGGTHANIILLTARRHDESSVSSLFMISRDMIPPESVKKLSLPFLRTIEHASLEMNEVLIPQNHLIPIDSLYLRRFLARWSIIERALIAEAVVGICRYVASKIDFQSALQKSLIVQIEKLLLKTQNGVREMLTAALAEEKIPMALPLMEIAECYAKLKDLIAHPHLPQEISLRADDLSILEKFS
ncbi:MAG: hypothetical protein N2316_11280 [Spirochaetes bacterium]|nr:hypothetical protein [Spirochaetota bacterium]